MKRKKIALAALAVAGALALSACSVRVETLFAANWLSAPSAGYIPDYYEKLTYGISFAADEGSSLSVQIDAENSSYTMETEALAGWTYEDRNGEKTTYSKIYRLRTELTLSASYVYTAEDGTQTTVAAFGGANDTEESDADDPAKEVTEVWFRSKADGGNLEPICSTSTWYSYSPAGMSSSGVYLYNYSVNIEYTENGNVAAIKYTDGWADLAEGEAQVSDNLLKARLFDTEERTYSGLQDDYTAVDHGQLLFAGRGIGFTSAEESGHTLTVFTPNYGAQNVSLTCSEIATRTFTFDLIPVDETEEIITEHQIAVAAVTASVISNGGNGGPSHTVYYAQKGSDSDNPYYCMPIQIEKPFGFGIGTMTLSLTEALHTRTE